jgi:hypothetical protein
VTSGAHLHAGARSSRAVDRCAAGANTRWRIRAHKVHRRASEVVLLLTGGTPERFDSLPYQGIAHLSRRIWRRIAALAEGAEEGARGGATSGWLRRGVYVRLVLHAARPRREPLGAV